MVQDVDPHWIEGAPRYWYFLLTHKVSQKTHNSLWARDGRFATVDAARNAALAYINTHAAAFEALPPWRSTEDRLKEDGSITVSVRDHRAHLYDS